jgi:ABC-type branched-subunit amino acid transport system substrate-binding protein
MKPFQIATNLVSLIMILTLAACATVPEEVVAPTAGSEEGATGEVTPAVESEAPDVYRIGLSFPLTGDLATYGDSGSKAAILAQEEINEAGGINGIPIEVVVEDDRCDAEGGLTVLNKLNADGVPVVTGFLCSSGVLGVCERYAELNTVQYVIGSNPQIWAENGCGDYTFGFFGNDLDQGREQARLLLEDMGVTEVGVIYTNNDYGIGVKDAFVAAFEEGGGTIVIELGVQQEGTDFRTEVARLKEAAPRVTVFEMYGPTGATFLKQAVELGVETQFVGDNNWASMDNLMLEPVGAEGMLAPTTVTDETFVQNFQARWGVEPAFASDLVYDQIYVAAKAIGLGGYTGPGIRDVTAEVTKDFVGASGPKYMPGGQNVVYDFSWVRFVDGELVPFEP